MASGPGEEKEGFSAIVEFLAKDPRKRTGMKASRSFSSVQPGRGYSKEGQCSDAEVVGELGRGVQVSAPVILGFTKLNFP